MSLPLLVDRDGNAIGSSREEEKAAPETDVLTLDRLLAAALYDPEKSGVQVSTLLMDCARKNDKRAGYVRFACPDQWALSLGGEEPMRDVVLALRIDRSWVDAMMGKVAE